MYAFDMKDDMKEYNLSYRRKWHERGSRQA